MKNKINYILVTSALILIIINCLIAFTTSKYYANVDVVSSVSIAAAIFNLKENTGNDYIIRKGEQKSIYYTLLNYDDNNNINDIDMDYYIKIKDENGIEELPLNINLDGYVYISYDIDSNGNIINESGDIVDEDGCVIVSRNLTEEENSALRESLTLDKRGYGKFELKSDNTKDEEVLKFDIMCSNDYNGQDELNFTIEVIGISKSNKNVVIRKTTNLQLNIANDNQNENNEINENEGIS